jgi:hypothetical protein
MLLKNLGTYPRKRCLGGYSPIIPLGYVSGYLMPKTGAAVNLVLNELTGGPYLNFFVED